jgi:hypothetical protein
LFVHFLFTHFFLSFIFYLLISFFHSFFIYPLHFRYWSKGGDLRERVEQLIREGKEIPNIFFPKGGIFRGGVVVQRRNPQLATQSRFFFPFVLFLFFIFFIVFIVKILLSYSGLQRE